MMLGITCVIAACIGTFFGAWLFYLSFNILNKWRLKK